MEAIVLHDLAGFPDDAGAEMGVLQLLVLCPLNQPGVGGACQLLGHIHPWATAQGPSGFCGWILLGRVRYQASLEEADTSGVFPREEWSSALLHLNVSVSNSNA